MVALECLNDDSGDLTEEFKTLSWEGADLGVSSPLQEQELRGNCQPCRLVALKFADQYLRRPSVV